MPQGKIIFFNKKSKFGFIKGEDDKDYFVREKNLAEDVQENDLVEFEIKIASRGAEAVSVKKIKV